MKIYLIITTCEVYLKSKTESNHMLHNIHFPDGNIEATRGCMTYSSHTESQGQAQEEKTRLLDPSQVLSLP